MKEICGRVSEVPGRAPSRISLQRRRVENRVIKHDEHRYLLTPRFCNSVSWLWWCALVFARPGRTHRRPPPPPPPLPFSLLDAPPRVKYINIRGWGCWCQKTGVGRRSIRWGIHNSGNQSDISPMSHLQYTHKSRAPRNIIIIILERTETGRLMGVPQSHDTPPTDEDKLRPSTYMRGGGGKLMVWYIAFEHKLQCGKCVSCSENEI